MQFKNQRTLELEARIRRLRGLMHDHIEGAHDLDFDFDSSYLNLMGAIDTAARDVSWVAPEFLPSWRNRWYRKRRVEKYLRDQGLSRTVAKTIAGVFP